MKPPKAKYEIKVFTTYKQIWLDIDALEFGEPVLWKLDSMLCQYLRRHARENNNLIGFRHWERNTGIYEITKMKGFVVPVEHTLSYGEILEPPYLPSNQEAFEWLVENCQKEQTYLRAHFSEIQKIFSVCKSPVNALVIRITTVSRSNPKLSPPLYLIERLGGEIQRPPAYKGRRYVTEDIIKPKPEPKPTESNPSGFYSEKDWWMREYQF